MPHTRNEESRSVVSGDLGNAYNKKANRQINVLVILDPPNPARRARHVSPMSLVLSPSLSLSLSLSLPPSRDSFHPRLCFLLPAITQERNQILRGTTSRSQGREVPSAARTRVARAADRSIDRSIPLLDHPSEARKAASREARRGAKRTLLGNSLRFQFRNALPLDRARSQPHGKVVASLARLLATEKRIECEPHLRVIRG